MKSTPFILSLLLLSITLSCKQQKKKSETPILKEPSEFIYKPQIDNQSIVGTPEMRKFDKLKLPEHISLISILEEDFKILKENINSFCISSNSKSKGIKKTTGLLETKWKKRGDILMNRLIKIDPMGNRSALYPYHYRLIKQLRYVLPGSAFLACTKKTSYEVQLTKFTEQIKNIRLYISVISK